MSFLQRFSSSLNPHFYFHLCVSDWLFEDIEDDADPSPTDPNTRLRFHGATDRAGPERLIRYRARPPFALDRLHLLGNPSDQILCVLPGPPGKG